MRVWNTSVFELSFTRIHFVKPFLGILRHIGNTHFKDVLAQATKAGNRCSQCSKKFKSVKGLQQHLVVEHKLLENLIPAKSSMLIRCQFHQHLMWQMSKESLIKCYLKCEINFIPYLYNRHIKTLVKLAEGRISTRESRIRNPLREAETTRAVTGTAINLQLATTTVTSQARKMTLRTKNVTWRPTPSSREEVFGPSTNATSA